MDYKETFLRCVEEGYDAAKEALAQKKIMQSIPYDQEKQAYEYNAWCSGHDWYCAEVH